MGYPQSTPLVLLIRDGWGRNPHPEHDAFNAVTLAKTPVAHRLERDYPHTLIKTSGLDVGLPEGTMGNSEVGHQNIGAGRIVDQESVRITKACRSGAIRDNPALADAIKRAKKENAAVHLMGIASDAGVHGQLEHLYALVRLCKELGQPRVFIHLFTDGRDTGPYTGKGFIEQVEAELRKIGLGTIASVMGRYWAMDRDNRWERIARAYRCLTHGTGVPAGAEVRTDPGSPLLAPTAAAAVQHYYDHPMSPTQNGDEFITPTIIAPDPKSAAALRIADHDTAIFYNYRGDRPREILAAFLYPDFFNSDKIKPSPDSGVRGFDRGPRLNLDFVTMTAYSEALTPYVKVAFPKPPKLTDILGEHLSKLGLTQFRCAETEKYPHVTFFFNDYRDEPFPGERRENPQSPKVATYDLKPEMAAEEVCQAVLRRLAAPDCEHMIVVNFANGDMVGHTGNLQAAVQACEVVDACVGRIVDATLARNGSLIITADHGNAEQMWNPETNSPHTAHTTYDVPLIVAGAPFKGRQLRAGGRLADIAPTALEMLGLPVPRQMAGRPLLSR